VTPKHGKDSLLLETLANLTKSTVVLLASEETNHHGSQLIEKHLFEKSIPMVDADSRDEAFREWVVWFA
jgi:hypothetical protein